MKNYDLAYLVLTATEARKAAEAAEERAKEAFEKAMLRLPEDRRFVMVGTKKVVVEPTNPRTFNEAFLVGVLDTDLLDAVAPPKGQRQGVRCCRQERAAGFNDC